VQAEEQSAEASSQTRKAAAKRARKKMAKQRAATADPAVHVAGNTAQPAAATCGAAEAAHASNSSLSAAEAHAQPQPAAAAAADTDLPPVWSAETAADQPAATSDWWRCPLSGRVMRDPVLCGGSGHSFERAALEQWLADHPGVEPLTWQPLPPGAASDMLPNHALRNMIQQRQLG
jgi:U-box domain